MDRIFRPKLKKKKLLKLNKINLNRENNKNLHFNIWKKRKHYSTNLIKSKKITKLKGIQIFVSNNDIMKLKGKKKKIQNFKSKLKIHVSSIEKNFLKTNYTDDDSDELSAEIELFSPIDLTIFQTKELYQEKFYTLPGKMFYKKTNFTNPLLAQIPPILSFLDYEKSKDEINFLTSNKIKSGQIGELILHNSGRAQLKIGEILLNIERSFINKCEERLIYLNLNNNACFWLGEVQPQNHIITNYSFKNLF